MTSNLLAAFGRELLKLGDGVVVENHPDQREQGIAQGAIGAGAVGLAGAGGYQLGKVLNRQVNNFADRQNSALQRVRRAEARTEMERRMAGVHSTGSLLPSNDLIPDHFSSYSASPAEERMYQKALADHGVQLFTEAEKVPGGGVAAGQSSYYHPGDPTKAIPKHVYLDMAGGQLPHVMAHELGHMGGWRGLQKLPLDRLYATGMTAPVAIGALGAYEALANKKRTPEERDKLLKKVRNVAIAGGALALPQLAEEARASIRAVNMGRKVGRGMEYAKHLLPAFGTYAAKPLATTAGAALGVEALRRYLKHRDTKTTPESGS